MKKTTYFIACILLLSAPCIASNKNKAITHFYQKNWQKTHHYLNQIPIEYFKEKPILRSMVYLNENKHRQSQSALSQYHTTNSTFTNAILFIKIKQALLNNNPKLADTLAKMIDKNNTNRFFYEKKAKLELSSFFLKKQKFSLANDMIDRLKIYRSDPTFDPLILQQQIEMAYLQKNIPDIQKYYGRLIQKYPEQDRDQSLWKRLLNVIRKKRFPIDTLNTIEEHYTYLKNLFRIKAYKAAIAEARYIIDFYPTYKNLPDVYLISGLSLYQQHQYQAAVDDLYYAILYDKTSKLHPKAYYFSGLAFEKLNANSSALKIFQSLSHIKTKYQPKAIEKMSQYHNKQNPHIYQEWVQKLKKHINHYVYDKYHFEKKWKKLKTIMPRSEKEGLLYLKKHIFPESFQASLFHLLKKDNKNNYASNLLQYPISYKTYKTAHNFYTKKQPIAHTNQTVSYYIKLYEMGLANLALEQIHYIKTNEKPSLELLYAEAIIRFKLNQFEQTIKTISNGLSDNQIEYGDIPYSLIPYYYPIVHWSSIQKYSRKYRVDPFLILAIMHEQSQFNPKKINDAMHIGLMQLNPQTIENINIIFQDRIIDITKLINIDLNIKYGCYFLSKILNKYQHNLPLSIGYYLTDPKTVSKWNIPTQMKDTNKIIQQISIPKIKEKTNRIIETYITYKLIYSNKKRINEQPQF